MAKKAKKSKGSRSAAAAERSLETHAGVAELVAPTLPEPQVASADPIGEPIAADSSKQATTTMDSNEQPLAAADSPAQPSAAAVITLGANCSVKDAAALKTSLCAVVETPDSVVLDAAAVERVDTATMQLLCAFIRERAAHSRTVAWQGTPSALTEAARLLGVQALLGLPQAASTGVAA
jgi:ABC-type transporter Mla MlaB component